MSHKNLYFDFSFNLDSKSTFKQEFFNKSLKDQYKDIKTRIPLDKQLNSFDNFIKVLLRPGMEQNFYLAAPSMEKTPRETDRGDQFYNNIAIWPEKHSKMSEYLPEGKTLILIGDIKFNPSSRYPGVLSVKGMELIPDDLKGLGEKVLINYTAIYKMNGNWEPNANGSDTAFNTDFIKENVIDNFMVDDIEAFNKFYKDWLQFIEFEEALLESKKKDAYELSNVEIKSVYEISKDEYRHNSDKYKNSVFENNKEFSQGDIVFLEEQKGMTPSFSVIKITHDKLLKDMEKNPKSYLKKLAAFTRDNVALSKSLSENNKNMHAFQLGERFGNIYPEVIEPSLEELENNESEEIETAKKEYEKLVVKQVNKTIKSDLKKKKSEQERELETKIIDYKEKLAKKLEDSNFETLPDAIKKEYRGLSRKIESDFNNQIKKKNKKKTNKKNSEEIEQAINSLKAEKEKALQTINLDAIKKDYIEKETERKKARLNERLDAEYETYETKKRKSLYKEIDKETRHLLDDELKQIQVKFEEKKQEKIDNETYIQHTLFFKPFNSDSIINKSITNENYRYLVYSDIAERTKLNRQKTALNNLYKGYVRNPFLLSFLFPSDTLSYQQRETKELNWYLGSLNAKQKEAVHKIMASKGMFLLQGPPGTGKTQVIAEAVSQLTKENKKVLVASETHKAIDNVFDRVPSSANVRPLRLIAHNKKKDKRYDPSRLVDNFYKSISDSMKNTIEEHAKKEALLDDIKAEYDAVVQLIEKRAFYKDAIKNNIDEIESVNKQITEKVEEKKKIHNELSSINHKIDFLKKTRDFPEDHLEEKTNKAHKSFVKSLKENIDESGIFQTFNNDLVDRLMTLVNNQDNMNSIFIDLEQIENNKELYVEYIKLTDEKRQLKNKADMSDAKQTNSLNKRRREVAKSLRKLEEDVNFESDELLDLLNTEAMLDPKNTITHLKAFFKSIDALKDNLQEEIQSLIEAYDDQQFDLEESIDELSREINHLNKRKKKYDEKGHSDKLAEIEEELNILVTRLFEKLEINENYSTYQDALKLVKKKSATVEKDLNNQADSEKKLSAFEKISNYIKQDEVIEQDRKDYTQALFKKANLFGITCTASDSYNADKIEAIGEYGLDDLDLKNVGIDVVIIDEVSKSSFLELLIPIQYSQQVILVGDHRQLSPFYQHQHMRKEDFEAINNPDITEKVNKKLKEVYETSYFKDLFMKLGDDFKVMLENQYRSHSQIMHVFNHFYDGRLKLGFDNQDALKRHRVKYHNNHLPWLEPDKHVYFINNNVKESRDENSTSIHNVGEKKLVIKLLKIIHESYKNVREDVEKPSIGVITTYGAQASKIKRSLPKNLEKRFPHFKHTQDERMIVNTVDDFQGDERDIIIVSMVRNPVRKGRSNASFISQFERINVAFSRARKLLIIVGNKEYLSEARIDLPDVNGNTKRDKMNYPVYRNIIETISNYRGVFDGESLGGVNNE